MCAHKNWRVLSAPHNHYIVSQHIQSLVEEAENPLHCGLALWPTKPASTALLTSPHWEVGERVGR